jgi:hypothetical protein
MPDVIDKVMSLIGRDGDSGSDKDILLRQLAKEISQNKYAKFYRVRQGEADPSMGQYFYSLYKAVYPMQVFFRDPAKDTRIRQITLESFLDKNVMDVIKRLSPEVIAERRKSGEDDLTKELQDDLTALAAGFDSPKIATADKCYNLIATIKQFVFFDFCSLLRKFDTEMKEGDFLTQPKFVPVDINILVNDIAAFASIMPCSGEDADWKTVFEILKYCRGGTDIIPLPIWNNLLINLKDLKQSKIFELINRLATSNPILEYKITVPNEALSALWLEQKTIEVREVISGIAGNQRNAQINAMEKAVFGPLATLRLNYYTPERGNIYLDKDLAGYDYASALNHLLAFIQEYVSKEIQELCDILLVRGQWTNNSASRTMSENFHAVVDITGEIIELDESLSDDGSNGPRMRGALLRIDRDKSQVRYINNIITMINENALNLINQAVQSLIVIGKNFKILMEDSEKKHFEVIMNWKELAGMSKVPMPQRIAAIYKKINYFVQLMMLEIKTEED